MKKVTNRKVSDCTMLTPHPDSSGSNQRSVKSAACAGRGRLTTTRPSMTIEKNIARRRKNEVRFIERSRKESKKTLQCSGSAENRRSRWSERHSQLVGQRRNRCTTGKRDLRARCGACEASCRHAFAQCARRGLASVERRSKRTYERITGPDRVDDLDRRGVHRVMTGCVDRHCAKIGR